MNRNSKRIKLVITGRENDYFLWTLVSWVLELYNFLCEELGAILEVEVRKENSDAPRLYVGEDLIFEGVPDEEGYLIEFLKHYVKSRKV